MKRAIPFLLVFSVAALAWAGSRAKDSDGSAPSAASDGVSLLESTGCRASVRVGDAGTIGAGKLLFYYYDGPNGWSESSSALQCSVTARADGGTRAAFVCPDVQVAAEFGRIGVSTFGLVGVDGGTPNGTGSDGGQNVPPVARIECWGAQLP